MDNSFDFDFDFDSDFENENDFQNHPLIEQIEKLSHLVDDNLGMFREIANDMANKYSKGNPLVNPSVIKAISEMKSFFESKCGIDKDEMRVEFNDLFNTFNLIVETAYLGIPGMKGKSEFDPMFDKCQGLDVTHLNNGKTEIAFVFHNAFLFTNPNA